MGEGVGRVGRSSPGHEEPGVDQAPEGLDQRIFAGRGDGVQELEGELPSEHRAELRHLLGGVQSVEPGHEQVLERGGNGVEGGGIGPGRPTPHARLRDHLRQLFQEQRDAIRSLDDAPTEVPRERRLGTHRIDEIAGLRGAEPADLEVHQALRFHPGRLELGAGAQQRQHPRGRAPLEPEGQELHGRGVAPVQVLDEQHEWTIP